MSINELIYSFDYNDESRDNLDSFLRKINFKYDVPSIHIAGTNGKSTVAYQLKNVYQAAKYKVGLFISSHYQRSIEEMIYINDEHISSKEIESIFNDHQKLFKKFDLSPFDIIVFIALSYFQNSGVDIALIETGIGGEYDSTNIFTPILSMITNISLEHTNELGVSLSEIARHKAGIIYNNVPTLIGKIEGDALDVIVNVAKRKESKIIMTSEIHNEVLNGSGISFEYKTHRDLFIPNLGHLNVINASLAIDAIDLLVNQFPVSEEALKEGLNHKLPKGKFEVINKEGITYVIDTAHNVEAIHTLRDSVDRFQLEKETYIVFATNKDKNITLMLPEIGLLGKIYISTYENKRAREESDYFLFLDEYEFNDNYRSLIKKIKEEHPECMIVVTGSSVFASLVSDDINNDIV